MVDYTPILRLVQPDFDQTPWDEDINNNLAILDAAYGKFITIAGLTGSWLNATAYVVGQVTVDGVSSTMWQCLVSHTSAASPTTFAQDRAAHPTYWTSVGAVLVYLPISGGTLTGGLGVTGDLVVTGKASANSLNVNTSVTADTLNIGTLASVTHTLNVGGTITANAMNVSTTVAAPNVTATTVTTKDVSASGSYLLPLTSGYLTATSTTVEFLMEANGFRWEYVRSNGTLRWANVATGQTVMSIDGAGNMILKGTITPNGTPV